jgi:hypothetical protein
MKTFKDQSFLVVVTCDDRTRAIAACGEQAGNHLGWHSQDFIEYTTGFDPLPDQIGLWVWTGSIQITAEDRWLYPSFIDGSWRLPVLTDFARFGLPTPLPDLPAEVPSQCLPTS